MNVPERPPRRPLTWLRDGWLIVGITLVFFLALELGYRAEQALFHRPAPTQRQVRADSTLHPYAGQPWFAEFEHDLTRRRLRFDPYRSFWARPVATRYINVDSLGRRVTVQPPFDPATAKRVYMFGGSTMWGFTARDSFTIPSLTAAALKARGVENVEVENLAQGAYNSMQEATTLLVELANGRVPDVAVFLDGYNDMATAGKYGEPGHTYGDEGIQQQISLGTRGFWGELIGLGRHSMLVARLRGAIGLEGTSTAWHDPKSFCGSVAAYYRNVRTSVAALGDGYGFRSLAFLQPSQALTNKPMTTWEKALYQPKNVRPCAASIDSAMADQAGKTYFSLASLFDQDTATVFVDLDAHVTETANAVIAAAIADQIAPLLTGRSVGIHGDRRGPRP